jgi:hypothetical protein
MRFTRTLHAALLVATASLSAGSFGSDNIQSMRAAGNWLLPFQNANGGWPWSDDDPTLYTNVQGDSGRGILDAYVATGEPAFLNAAILTGNYLLTKQNNTSVWSNGSHRFATADAIFMVRLSHVTGNSVYRNYIQTEFWDRLAAGTYGDSNHTALSLGMSVVTTRISQGIPAISPYDISFLAVAAHIDGQTSLRDDFMAAILAGLEATPVSAAWYDVLGLACAVWASAVTGVDLDPQIGRYAAANSSADLLNLLLAQQRMSDGGFYYINGAPPNMPWATGAQETAFALLALDAWDSKAFQYRIQRGVSYLHSLQEPSGQFAPYTGGPLTGGGSVSVVHNIASGLSYANRAISQSALPVDLNGRYIGPSISETGLVGGAAAAATGNIFINGFNWGQVLERSGPGTPNTWNANALEGTYTPFSDDRKAPMGLAVTKQNLTYSATVDLSGSWQSGDLFGLSIFGTDMTAGVQITHTGSAFRLVLASALTNPPYTFAEGGTAYVADPAETQFEITVVVNATGILSATVTPINGPSPNTPRSLGSFDPQQGSVNLPNVVSFQTGFHNTSEKSTAYADVSDFTTTASGNWMYLFADDPYVKSVENASFRFGMANLQQVVGAFQAFLNALNHAGPMPTYVGGSYTTTPFSFHYYPLGAQGSNLAAGIGTNDPLVDINAVLANLNLSGTNGSRFSLGILVDNGAGLSTTFYGELGNPYGATRQMSNVVLVDDVPPVISQLDAKQGPRDIFDGIGIQTGPLKICVDARDVLSGLKSRPVVKIDFHPIGSNNGEDVTLQTYSGVGNEFCAEYVVPFNAPQGNAQIIITAEDAAGNEATLVSQVVNVNTAVLVLDLELQSLATGGPTATRYIEIVVGGNGGPNNAVILSRNVTFSSSGAATVTFTSADGLPATPGLTLDVSARDPRHTIRERTTLTTNHNQHSASLVLRGGNFNQDNLIDIGDYVVYAVQFGQNVGINTPGAPPPTERHADASGNGIVDSADFSYISANFGLIGSNQPGQFTPQGRVRRIISVQDAMREANSREPAKMDLDGDGWITLEEIQKYLQRFNSRR